jgi:hypothetical protein
MAKPWRIELFHPEPMVWHNGNKHDYNRTVHNYNPNDKSKPPAIRTGVAGRLLLSRLAFETGESISLDKLKKMLEPGTDMDTDLHFRNIKTLFTGNATGLSEIFSEVSDALSLRSELVTTDVVEFRRAIQSEKVMVLKSALEISPPKMMLSRFNDLDKRQIQWLIKGREKLQKSYQDALERLTRMLAQGGQVQDALEYRQRIVREGFADKCKDLPSEEDIKNNSCKGSFTFRRAMHQSWNVALDEFKSSRNDYLVYADMVETNLPLDSATKATDERNESAYQICAALVSLSMADDYVTEARILLPADPYVAFQQKDRSVKDKYRRVLEYGKTSGWPCWGDLEKYRLGEVPSVSNLLMRFAAGGAITILNVPSDDGGREDFVVIGQKDNGPVIHAGHLIPCSGIAESSEDWLNPLRIVVGECAEEIRLRHRKNNDWYFPVFSPQENVAGLTTQSQCDVLNEFVEVQRGKRQELLTGVTANNKKPSFVRKSFPWVMTVLP